MIRYLPNRAVAQGFSVLDWGSRGRRFKSAQPDKSTMCHSLAHCAFFVAWRADLKRVSAERKRGKGHRMCPAANEAGRRELTGRQRPETKSAQPDKNGNISLWDIAIFFAIGRRI